MLIHEQLAHIIGKLKKKSKKSTNNKLRILCYHSISNLRDNHVYPKSNVTINQFYKQMVYLKNNNFNCLNVSTLEKYLEGKCDIPDKAFIVTFDDCFRNILKNALPILENFKYHCILFIATDFINTKERFNFIDWYTHKKSRYGITKFNENENGSMTFDDIEKVSKNKSVIIGSHGCSHKNFKNLDNENIIREFRDSRKKLEKIIHKPVIHFAFPYGEFNHEIFQYALNEYKYIYGTNKGIVKKGGRFKRPIYRHSIHSKDTLEEFSTQMFGGYDNFVTIRNLLMRI